MWLRPGASADTEPAAMPLTCTGERWLANFPLPSCPLEPLPQHQASPATTAQVCFSPAVTEVAPCCRVSAPTLVGSLRVELAPSPSWPYVFCPQQ